MRNLNPKPTTYKGVTYRSKSEAKLAVCFDSWGFDYCYEPDCFRVDNWTPDFVLVHPHRKLRRIIEYKPCKPTNEYINELANRFGAIIEQLKNNPYSTQTICELWCVDFWKNETCGLQFQSAFEIAIIDDMLRGLNFTAGNRWRFDLNR